MSKTTPSQDLIKARRKRDAALRQNPTCSKCGITKTVADFPSGCVDYWCSECRTGYARELYRKRRAGLSGGELERFRAPINAKQNKRRREKIASFSDAMRAKFFAKVNADNKSRRDAVRDDVYRAYGGYVCNCCGVTEPKFLSVDHVHNDGAAHRRQEGIKTGEQLHRWLKRNNYPSGFQILCMNCQWGKRNNNGVCPHQSSKV